jgi:UDP-N-acetylmuramate dehydrogenase
VSLRIFQNLKKLNIQFPTFDHMISLKPYNTFGIESYASELIYIRSEDDLYDLKVNSDLKILGGGSNVLITKDVEAPVLKNEIKGIEIINDHPDYVDIRVGAGEIWHELVLWTLENNLGGIENLSLVPGCVGAAPVQNIGAYGVELKDVLVTVDGIFISDKQKKTFTNAECKFSYRTSLFKTELKDQFFITHLVLRLQKKHTLHLEYGNIKEMLDKWNIPHPTIHDVSKAVIEIRNSKLPDPKKLGNAGSFFKNSFISTSEYVRLKNIFPNIPGFAEENDQMKIPSGWLIEQCGWKGKRNGDAGCYDKQALVLVNYGNASGSEILHLANQITDSVFDKFGIALSFEVNVW